MACPLEQASRSRVTSSSFVAMFVMVSVTVVMRVGDNNQEDGRTTLECEQTQSKLQETEGIKGLKIKKEIKEGKIQKKKKKI